MSEASYLLSEMLDEQNAKNMRVALSALLGKRRGVDLACVGISIEGLGACTFDAIAHIVSADVVFCYPTTPAHLYVVQKLNPAVVNMYESHYIKGKQFDQAYDAIVEEVLDEVKKGKKVAYATEGSPAFHCGTAAVLTRRARELGFSTALIPGVSSFDLLCASVVPDHDLTSVQVYSIFTFVGGRARIDTRLPCFLCDLGRFAMPAVRERSSTYLNEKLSLLGGALRRIYPPSHDIFIMKIQPANSSLSVKTTMQDLEQAFPENLIGCTIFVPGCRNNMVAQSNPELATPVEAQPHL